MKVELQFDDGAVLIASEANGSVETPLVMIEVRTDIKVDGRSFPGGQGMAVLHLTATEACEIWKELGFAIEFARGSSTQQQG